jgi:hypothetical protein
MEVPMNHDGVTTATMLLLAAFAVDRIVSAVIFIVFRPRRSRETQDIERAAWSQKLWYFIVASILAAAILAATSKVRLLQAMGMVYDTSEALDKFVDLVLTFMVLVGGAERISALLQSSAPASTPEPLEVQGTITLTDSQQATRTHTTGQ